MSADKMHVDEVDVDISLVGRLLAAQFPQWADLPIVPVHSAGTDNALYRLGSDMVVRLPRIEGATGQIEKEQWWLPGENATIVPITDPDQAARDLAHFIAALQRIDPTGGPPPGPHNFFRGVPLSTRDTQTRTAIASLHDMLDTRAVTAAWEGACQAPAWSGPPVWIHGDLQPLNLLVEQGRLSAVIDFGGLGVGDPACDLMAALPVDDATWVRGRGWALSMGLIALPYYQITNPVLAGIARRAIDEALADQKHAA